MKNKNDSEKYFDSKEYITKIIGAEDESEVPSGKAEKIASIISIFTDKANKSFKEETLLTLKKEKSGELLLLAIASPELKNNKHLLVAACWESEINFSNYLPFFILLALDQDYLVSLEAITVIAAMEGPFNIDQIKEGIIKVKGEQKKTAAEKAGLLNDLAADLKSFLIK